MLDARLRAVQAMLDAERYAEAMRVARAVLASDPEDSEAHRLLAMGYAGSGELDLALKEVRSALALGPASLSNAYSLAYVYSIRGELKLAEKATRDALALEPDNPVVLRLLAHIELAQGRPRSSLLTTEMALGSDPSRVHSYVARADALLALNRPAEAVAVARAGLMQEPNEPEAYATLGRAEAELDHHTESAVAFREALRLDPMLVRAQKGFIRARKLRNPIYRALRGRYRFLFLTIGTILIGAIASYRPAQSVASALLIFGLFAFVFMDHLMTLRIRFDREGRRALSATAREDSNLFAIALGVEIVAVVVWLVTRYDAAAFAAMMFCVTLLFSTVATGRGPRNGRRTIIRNMIASAVATVTLAVILSATGSPVWVTENERVSAWGGPLSAVQDIAMVVIGFEVLMCVFFVFGFSFQLLCIAAARTYNRSADRVAVWRRRRLEAAGRE